MTDEYLVVVIAPDRNPEKCLLRAANWEDDSNWSYVTVDKNGDTVKDDNNSLSNDCIFVLINQCQPESEIKILLENNIKKLDKKVIAWTHKTTESYIGTNYKSFPCRSIEKILTDKIIYCNNFSHTDESPAKPILDFMESFLINQSGTKRIATLEKIIEDTIKINAVSEAYKLRADILTPFIPFHLYHQLGDKENRVSEWEEIFKECCKEINKKEDSKKKTIVEEKCEDLIRLKNTLSNGDEEFYSSAFESLQNNFLAGKDDCVEKVKETDCHKTIEEFAEYLEGIVNSIEDGEGN